MKFSLRLAVTAMFLGGAAVAQEPAAPAFEVLTETTQSWDGSALPAYPDGTPEITILRVTYPPGAGTNLHRHPIISAGVLISGELTVYTEGDEKLELHAGDSLVEVVREKHYGRNEGDVPAVLLMFYAGVEEQPITIPRY